MRAFTLAEAVSRGFGNERPFLCPVHGDSRPSASLNIIKQVWICYTCGAHGTLTGEDALIEPDYAVMKQWFADKMEEQRVYPESWLSRWDAGPVHPYWLHRVGEAAARHFRLGYDSECDAVTYPLRGRSGEVLGVVRRHLGEDSGPKYRYPRGVDVGRLLFNFSHEGSRSCVLVEGALDAIPLWSMGVERPMAIYGSRLSEAQVQLIDQLDPTYVFTAFDNDDAGYRAHQAVEDAMRHRLVSRITWPASWGKDIDEIGLDRRRQIMPKLAYAKDSILESASCESPQRKTRSLRTASPSTSKPRGLRIMRSAS